MEKIEEMINAEFFKVNKEERKNQH
jgi:hypothetical protein